VPSAKELRDLYSASYFAAGGATATGYGAYLEDATNLRAMFRSRLRYLPLPSPEGRLLDIGAATGHFVEQAREYGWDAQGIELSEWAAEYARTTLGQPVSCTSLADANYPDEYFEVVTLWEVIEHLPNVGATLAEVRRIVRPGGHLALSTPDAGSLVARLAGRRWLGWSKVPEHISFFDRRALTRLLDASGFVVESARYAPLRVPLNFALDRLIQTVGLKARVPLPAGLGRRGVWVNPYYDLLIVARAVS